jgi:hypothetical protein
LLAVDRQVEAILAEVFLFTRRQPPPMKNVESGICGLRVY